MRRELELARRLHTLEVLGEAVGAMKTLSAHHYREVRGAVEPARAYREGIERIVGWAGAHLGAGEGGAGLIIIGAELGLCGGYNARVVEVAPSAVPSSVRGPPSASGTVPPRFSGAWTLGSRGRIRDPRALEDSRACSSSSGKKCCPPTSRTRANLSSHRVFRARSHVARALRPPHFTRPPGRTQSSSPP